jgi:ribA/ribD-fused uncharacterized protein
MCLQPNLRGGNKLSKVLEAKGFTYEGVLNKNPDVLIDWFDDLGTNNPLSFLSNFYEGSPFKCYGKVWATSEHAYAAQKVYEVDEDLYLRINRSTDPQEAKTLGRTAPVIRHDWEEIKYNVMKTVVAEKFLQNHMLIDALLGTGNAYLQEGTFWHDTVWGVNLVGTNPDGSTGIIEDPLLREGKNWLGTILMELRAKIRLGIATSSLTQ